MINIDYKALQELNKQKQGASSWYVTLSSDRDKKYIVLIGALRVLNWRHRDILDYLLENDSELFELNERNPINNNQLSKIVSKWNTKGILGDMKDRILQEVKKIQGHKTQEQIEEELANDFLKV